VTLIDKRNFHLFQPLLYQIATGSLSPGEIASPLRSVLRDFKNMTVLMDEVTGIDPKTKSLTLKSNASPMAYDMLVLATGGATSYFGHNDWVPHAHGLKTVEDALNIRRQIFLNFEAAEKETDPAKQQALITFIIVGGGPTGVELAGALAELSRFSLPPEFRHIDCKQAQILLVEMGPRILATYPPALSQKAAESLQNLGVSIRTNTAVTDIQEGSLTLSHDGQSQQIHCGTVLWAAGVRASPLGDVLAQATGCTLDRGGRVLVNPDLSLPNYPDIFVLGDLANYAHTPNGIALPGVASVAIQQGEYLAKLMIARIQGRKNLPFKYVDKGSLAVIGMKEAVANLHQLKLSGFMAWLIWAFVHIMYLVEFDNKLLVMFQWGWTLLTRRQGARLITGPEVYD
jgi:NADH dehydrogenase